MRVRALLASLLVLLVVGAARPADDEGGEAEADALGGARRLRTIEERAEREADDHEAAGEDLDPGEAEDQSEAISEVERDPYETEPDEDEVPRTRRPAKPERGPTGAASASGDGGATGTTAREPKRQPGDEDD